MEPKQITLESLYLMVEKMQVELNKINQRLSQSYDWEEQEVLADENILAECWVNSEEDEAWKDL